MTRKMFDIRISGLRCINIQISQDLTAKSEYQIKNPRSNISNCRNNAQQGRPVQNTVYKKARHMEAQDLKDLMLMH